MFVGDPIGGTGPGQDATGNGSARAAQLKDAYEEGKRAVDDQMAELDSMRQRSVQFLAFVGSATAFLVGTGLAATSAATQSGTPRDGWFYFFAITASVLSLVMILLVLAVLLSIVRHPDGPKSKLGRAHFDFRNSSRTLVEDWIDPPSQRMDEARYFRNLAITYDQKYEENEPFLSSIRVTYAWFLSVGTAQLVLWSVVVWAFA